MEEFAEEIGVDSETLRQYRQVAAAWTDVRRRTSAAWSVYKELGWRDDRQQILNRLAKQGAVTVDAVRRELGKQPTRPEPATPRGQVELAKELLDDPRIRREIVRDDRVRRDLNVAEREIDAGRAATVARRQREDAPRLAEARELYDAKARIHRARSEINIAVEALRGLPALDADEREALRYDVELLEASVSWLSEFTKARRPVTLANEVEAFLADQEA